jgi:hypothetical protein
MKEHLRFFVIAALVAAVPACAQSAAAVAGGTGLYVAPSSQAYALLTNAAQKMLDDTRAGVPGVQAVVLYDPATFANVPYYPSAVEQVKLALRGLCKAPGQPRVEALGPADLGAAASGLAALIGVTLPSYAISGQAVTTIDTSALVGVFAAAAKQASLAVINPVYLLPAEAAGGIGCGNFETSQSIASLWALAAVTAHNLEGTAAANVEPGKSALAQFKKLSDVYLAADKGMPLLSKLLVVESLLYSISDPEHTAVIDMKLDGAGIDSTTRTILWWRSTKVSSNVLAHYSVLKVGVNGGRLALTLVTPGYVNFMTKDINQKTFSSAAPLGTINPPPNR